MKTRSIFAAWIIIVAPFLIGGILVLTGGMRAVPGEMSSVQNTLPGNRGIEHKGIGVDWIFCPDWKFKPLLLPAEEYLVFVFHYTNRNDYPVRLMPSYTLSAPPHRPISANEEISMYIEDRLEDELKFEDQTCITFDLAPNASEDYIVSFEKPSSLAEFAVEVELFRDVTLRLGFKKENGLWRNFRKELMDKYQGRG